MWLTVLLTILGVIIGVSIGIYTIVRIIKVFMDNI